MFRKGADVCTEEELKRLMEHKHNYWSLTPPPPSLSESPSLSLLGFLLALSSWCGNAIMGELCLGACGGQSEGTIGVFRLLISVISGRSWFALTSGMSKADTFIQPLRPQKRSDSFNGGRGLPISTKWPLAFWTRLDLPPPLFFYSKYFGTRTAEK